MTKFLHTNGIQNITSNVYHAVLIYIYIYLMVRNYPTLKYYLREVCLKYQIGQIVSINCDCSLSWTFFTVNTCYNNSKIYKNTHDVIDKFNTKNYKLGRIVIVLFYYQISCMCVWVVFPSCLHVLNIWKYLDNIINIEKPSAVACAECWIWLLNFQTIVEYLFDIAKWTE